MFHAAHSTDSWQNFSAKQAMFLKSSFELHFENVTDSLCHLQFLFVVHNKRTLWNACIKKGIKEVMLNKVSCNHCFSNRNPFFKHAATIEWEISKKTFCQFWRDLPFFRNRKKCFVMTLLKDSLCKRFTSSNPVANRRWLLLFCFRTKTSSVSS